MRKTAAVTVLLALALVSHGCGVKSPNERTGEEAVVVGVGEPARDGRFRMTVKEAKCGAKKVGAAARRALGKFCLVTVDVKNVGSDPGTFLPDSQRAYSAEGVEFLTDPAAVFSANENNIHTLLNEIDPGDQMTSVLIFDVPQGTWLTKVHLHDSHGSVGIVVSLA